jgi:hypothetical protein
MKTPRRRRLLRGTRRVVCGTQEAVKQGRAVCGWQRHPALLERITRSMRQHVAAGGRRVRTRGQGEDGLRQPLAWSHVSDHCGLPHASLRQP